MNFILLRLQKNNFLVLLPIVLFFTYSLAYLIRSIVIVFLNPGQQVALQSENNITVSQGEAMKSLSVYEDVVQGNLIRGQIISASDSKFSTGAPGEAEDSNSDEMLVTGTISGHPSFARVTILEKGKDESEEYPIGGKIQGYKIHSIGQHFVVLEKNGLNLKVEIGETIQVARQRVTGKAESTPKDELASTGTVKKILSREDVNAKLKDPALIYKDAKFGPNLVSGKIDGYKLYQVSSNHIFYSLGARSGDIVKRVNGMPLNDTGKMLEMWNNIKSAQKITVDIERSGKIITYEFIIRN
ncbi:MAG: general secretion pathway protein GspC [Leptospiraceae bacterium]|nr:general secretion pathway protein GspC [Leptospiraceae bacterium]MCK6379834.1 general secretion pathway protein GspC [Leptospiraceae bacterium]NUM40974.1 general secretion pathway protein GspC [Leptospiraceae bacterium]